MAKNTSKSIPRKSTTLTPSQLEWGISKIQKRIEDLKAFDVSAVSKRSDASTRAISAKVDSTLREVLGEDTAEYSDFAIRLDTLPLIMNHSASAHEVQANLRENVKGAITRLLTLIEILTEKLEDAQDRPAVAIAAKQVASTRKVFVVHGHDGGIKDSVARYLGKLDLDPVILHEKANEGRTIIEKFEAHSEVDFAVVLFTPDDIGYATGDEANAQHRPRQNVILELGFFIGRLGRDKVCVLHKGDMEMLSDIAGVLYIPVDAAGHWQLLLAKEIKSAGLNIDLNKAID